MLRNQPDGKSRFVPRTSCHSPALRLAAPPCPNHRKREKIAVFFIISRSHCSKITGKEPKSRRLLSPSTIMSTTMRVFGRVPRQLSRRSFSMTTRSALAAPFGSGPAPPRLPKEEQEIFEKLQRQSTGAFSTPRESDEAAAPSSTPNVRIQVNQSPDSSSSRPQINQSPDSSQEPEIRFENGKEIRKGEEFHPNMRRGAPPEFEGDVNPKTGEVGGPKNEPLRWGHGGDWSYNGRVTDF